MTVLFPWNFGVFPLHILKRDSNENGDIFWANYFSVNHYLKPIPGTSDAVRSHCLFIMTENWLCLSSRQKTDWSTTLLTRNSYQVISNRSFWAMRDAELFLVLKFLVLKFWCWIESLQDAVLYSFHLLNWDLPPWKSMKLSSSLDSFDALNGASCGEAGYYDTGYLRWSCHWRAAVFLTFQKLPTWCWRKNFPTYSIVHTTRYFGVVMFFWLKFIYLFLSKETGLLQWK